jgi:hypothetical protein
MEIERGLTVMLNNANIIILFDYWYYIEQPVMWSQILCGL